jgi:hypothetical protein
MDEKFWTNTPNLEDSTKCQQMIDATPAILVSALNQTEISHR